ncbi:hypothetical protein GCM10017778_31280 [Streptomyces vinaceus]|nr:hypothetical protein GCM10017778_31280 [Streptomyces vinaceus]
MLGPIKIKIKGSRSQPHQIRIPAQDSKYVVGACHGRTVTAAADTRSCTVSKAEGSLIETGRTPDTTET